MSVFIRWDPIKNSCIESDWRQFPFFWPNFQPFFHVLLPLSVLLDFTEPISGFLRRTYKSPRFSFPISYGLSPLFPADKVVSGGRYLDNFWLPNMFVKLLISCATKLFLFGILLCRDSDPAESESLCGEGTFKRKSSWFRKWNSRKLHRSDSEY
jgi:hypothetical protein